MYVSIILAAGEGTRMKSSIPKVLHKVCGKEMIKHIIETVEKAEVQKNIIILGHGKEKIEKEISQYNVITKEQPIGDKYPYGTGYATMQAIDYIDEKDTVIVLNGDTPLIKSETIENFINFHVMGKYAASVLTADFDDPTGYGRIVRNEEDNLSAIVEHKEASDEIKNIKEINSGMYCFNGGKLKCSLKKLNSNNSQNEYYLTDVIKILNSEGFNIGGFKIENNIEISGVNNRVQLASVNNEMQRRINENHMLNGVTIINSNNTYIEESVIIGKDTIIYPGSYLEKGTIIGDNCTIGPNSRIINSTIENDTTIDNSKIIDSEVGCNTNVGPYAYLRPESKIGNNVKIGDFVEIKKSIIGNNSKASHLAYIGDTEIGENVNVGCGVVIVNYDGKNKHKTIIKDGAFVGSNSNLIAPVTINEGAYVASGSTITDNVEKEDLAIARARQVNKRGRGKNRF